MSRSVDIITDLFFLFPDVKPNGEIAKLQCSDYDVGNGICDPQCNFEHSLWDLGDCCQPFHTAFWCNGGADDGYIENWQMYNFDSVDSGLPFIAPQNYKRNMLTVEKYCECHITGENAAKPFLGNQNHCTI